MADNSSREDSKSNIHCVFQPIVVCEVKALIKYASEHGLDNEGVILDPIFREINEYVPPIGPSMPGRDTDAKIIVLYGKLSKLTFPVTGRSLLETEEKFKKAVLPLHLWTCLFLAVVITNEILKVWFADMVEPEEGLLLTFINMRRYVLDVCSPFLWGALGSCVWLLKRLSDYAEERTFDRALSRGWTSRILLGAILGGIVQYLYDPQLFTSGNFKLGASALGFLTGVGVKVVYGAIEKSIDVLAEKFNLDAKKSVKNDAAIVRTYLSDQLGKVDKVKEPEKQKLLTDLLSDASDQPASK